IIDRSRTTVEADIRGKWRLQPRLGPFSLAAFEQCGFFAADICARTVVHIEVEIPTGTAGVFAEQLGLIGLVDRRLQTLTLANELAAYVNVARIRAHREGGNQATFDQQM